MEELIAGKTAAASSAMSSNSALSPDLAHVGHAHAHAGVEHAAHHAHKAMDDDDTPSEDVELERQGFVDSAKYAVDQATKSGLKGGLMLAGFAVALAAVTGGATAVLAPYLTGMAATIVPGAIGAAVTGIGWFGAKSYMDARHEADHHNERIAEQTRAIEMAHQRGMEARVQAQAEYQEQSEERSTPRHVQSILDKGPRSLDPKALAERVAAERAQHEEHTR